MSEVALHAALSWTVLGLAVPTFLVLRFVSAPYGRHARAGWGPTLPSRIGWIAMEAVAFVGFALVFALGPGRADLVPVLLASMWLVHYGHRAFVFPFRLRASGKRIPLAIVAMGALFNTLNAYLNGRWLSAFGEYTVAWLRDPRFILGVTLFVTGFAINVWADQVLIRLRAPGESGYKIPRGGLYERVSCPNYLGELMEWTGFALACWSLPALAFAVYTAANLVPRALTHHAWYRQRFPDYPRERKAIVPFVL